MRLAEKNHPVKPLKEQSLPGEKSILITRNKLPFEHGNVHCLGCLLFYRIGVIM